MVQSKFNAIKTFNDGVTSFDLKKAFSCDPKGFYITNGQLKGAMEKAGFSLKATPRWGQCEIQYFQNFTVL